MVKVEYDDEKVQLERAKNNQLPAVLREIFGKKILPLVYCWAAAQANPWKPEGQDLIEAIETIGRLYAGDDYHLEGGRKSAEYRIVSPQRLSLISGMELNVNNTGETALQ